MKYAFSVAWKFLVSNKSQMVLIILGIAVGISVQIFIGLLIQSLQIDLINTTIGSSSHLTINRNEENFLYDDEIYKTLISTDQIEKVGPILSTNVFLEEETLVINGILLEKENDIYKLNDKMIVGRLPKNKHEIILGRPYLENYEVNDRIEVYEFDGSSSKYIISGFFDFNVTSVNETVSYTNLASLQANISQLGMINKYETQITDVFNSDEVKNNLNLDERYNITSWEDANQELLSGLSGQSASSIIIQVFIVISVVLAIASVLIISVMQKRKQIGILKAMGTKNRVVRTIFLAQGMILGALGSSLGLLLGATLLWAFSTYVVDANGESIINVYFNVTFIIGSFLIGIIASIIASIIPARKSMKLTPIEVIRNE